MRSPTKLTAGTMEEAQTIINSIMKKEEFENQKFKKGGDYKVNSYKYQREKAISGWESILDNRHCL